MGRVSELTMLSRLSEYCDLEDSCLRAVSAARMVIDTGSRGNEEKWDETFAMLRGIESCLEQLSDTTNVSRHD